MSKKAEAESSVEVGLSNDSKPLTITPDQVDVAVTVEEEQASREFDKVEIHAKGFKGTYTVTPQWAHFQLSGPKSTMAKAKIDFRKCLLEFARDGGRGSQRGIVVQLAARD